MNSTIRKVINSKFDDLQNAENLEQAVESLRFDCLSNLNERNKDEASRCFWLLLARHAVISRNIAVANLTAIQLNLNKSIMASHSSDLKLNEIDQQTILRYMANYLQIDDERHMKQETANDRNSLMSHEQSTNKFLEKYDWTGALESLGTGSMELWQKDQLKQLVSIMQGKYYETEENFSESIIYYEKSTTQAAHSPRVLLKHLMSSAHDVLENYCSTTTSLRQFWPDYLMACGKFSEAQKYHENQRDIVGQLNCTLLSGELKQDQLVSTLPTRIQQFIDNPDPSIWFEKKTVELVASLGSTLAPNQRKALHDLSNFYSTHNNMLKSCSIDLCLEDLDCFLIKMVCLFEPLKTIQLTTQVGSHHHLTSRLMDYLTQQHNSRTRHKLTQLGDQILFTAYLNLGLIDECLETFARANQKELINMELTIDFISGQINSKHNGSLEMVSPEIRATTLESVRNSLVDENDKDLTTHVITVVIMSLNIFLLKLEINDTYVLNESIPKLETIFRNLCELFNELSFNASDALVRASNGLVAAVKSKLDALIDSNPIREGFQQLIETTAGRCMIEGRYKSAAMLYSQIEDNVNAVKSLMRTGEVDTVINYALLVRDITVNRITINYLRHLGTDQEIIEDFIARSKS